MLQYNKSKYTPLVVVSSIPFLFVQVLVYNPVTVQSFLPLNVKRYLLKNKHTPSRICDHHNINMHK